MKRTPNSAATGVIVRGLLSVVSLMQAEAQRAFMALQRRGLPPEFGGEAREPWQGGDEEDVFGPGGQTAFDHGLFSAMASLAMSLLKDIDLSDAEQRDEIRNLFVIAQELCRENLAQQADRQCMKARCWRFLGNRLARGLQLIAEIDRGVIQEQPQHFEPRSGEGLAPDIQPFRPRRGRNKPGENWV